MSIPNKEQYIKENRERLFKLWLVRSCFYGSFLFLMLSGLDYLATPENFRTFFFYRVFIALLLAAIAFVAKETDLWGIRFHQAIGAFGVAASAGTIELMILQFGGHNSPYAAGQILLGVCVLGFLPAWMSFHTVSALLIYGIYFVPIMLFDHAGRSATFVSANGFLIAALASSLVLRFLSERTLEGELTLQYDLVQSEQKYRDLFEHAIDPIFVVDQDLRYVDANRKAVEMSGYSKEELKRRTILDMVPPEQVPRSSAEIEKLRQRGAYEKFEGKMVRKDGSLLDIEVSSAAVIRDGKIVGSHDFVREITDRKRFHDELKRSNEELDQHVRERTAALTEMNRVMEREIAERRKAEQRIGEQLERQRALSAVESAIASSLDLSLTLNVFIEQVMSQLRTDAAAVLLYDPELQELTFAAERGFRSNRIKKVTVRSGQSLAGRVIALREKIIIPDFEREDSRYPMPEGYSFKNAFMVREEGFRSYVGVPLLVKGQVKGIIEIFHRHAQEPAGEWLEFLEALARQAAIAIDNATMFEQLQRSHGEIIHAYDMTIEGWSRALDIRDNETHGHSQRVAALTIMTAEILGINGKELINVRRGALLHDIGKLGVPDSILLKPGKLTDEEMAIMKRHPTIAYDILSPIPFLREALDIPYLHHEKWDGNGYPKGLLGEAIPVPSRIFAVIDVWDALRSDRPYRAAWSEERIVEYLKAERGRHFDPEIVDVFLAKILPVAAY
ncbi:MAG: HD domain-containing phosphohydrolase [Nitrospirota bacterium]